MKPPFLLVPIPFVLLQAGPALAEVEFMPTSPRVEQIAPVEQGAQPRGLQTQLKDRTSLATELEQQEKDSSLVKGAPLGNRVENLQSFDRVNAPTPAKAVEPKFVAPDAPAGATIPAARPAPRPVRKAADTAPRTAAPPAASQPQTSDLNTYDQLVRQITAAEGDNEALHRLIKGSWDEVVRVQDFGTMARMAYVAAELGHEDDALLAARTAAEMTEDDQFYTTLIDILMRFNRMDEVDGVLKKMDPKDKNRKALEARIEQAKYDKVIADITKAAAEDRKEDVYNLIKGAWDSVVKMQDFGVMARMAYTSAALEKEEDAIMAARTAAEMTEDDEFYVLEANMYMRFKRMNDVEAVLKKMNPKGADYKKVLLGMTLTKANDVFKQGNYAEAEKILLEKRDTLDAGGLELLGWVQYRMGKIEEAASQFAEAYAKSPRRSNAQGLVFSLHRIKRYDELLQKAGDKPGPLDEFLSPEIKEAVKAGQTRFAVDSAGTLVVASGSGGGGLAPGYTVRIEPTYRNKKGTPGEGQLKHMGAQTTVTWKGERDMLSMELTGQRQDDGVDPSTRKSVYGLWERSTEAGISYRLGLGQSSSGDLLPAALLGEMGLSYYTPEWGGSARVFRRTSDDSVLAISGKRDPATGIAWGRVLQTGLSLSGYVKLDEWHTIYSLTAAELTGVNVASNRMIGLYSRALHPIHDVPGLSLGAALIASKYSRNLSGYELGHGGYYSPKQSVQLSGVASYDFKVSTVEMNLLSSAGYSMNSQSAEAGNPLTGENPDAYKASSGGGFIYSAVLSGSVPITSNWELGFSLGAQQSDTYEDRKMGLYAEGHY